MDCISFAYEVIWPLHDQMLLCSSMQLKVKIQTLKATLETASQHHSKEKQKYFQLGDNCQKLREKSDAKVNRRSMHPKKYFP